MPHTPIDQNEINKAVWNACDTFRGTVDPSMYKDYILTMLFLKYISDVHQDKVEELQKEYGDSPELIAAMLESQSFKIPTDCSFWDLYKVRYEPGNGSRINKALHAIEEANIKLKGVFQDISFNSDKLGDEKSKNDVLRHLLEDFGKPTLNLRPSRVGTLDVIGNAYEFLIKNFAASSGKSAGEFYTPAEVSDLLAILLEPQEGDSICDPACGSGGMFVQSETFVENHSGNINNLSIYGQEANADTWKMAKINMAIRGIEPNFGPHQADTFTNDLHPTLKADYIMANPPFNLKKWGADKLADDVRWKYGTPPDSNANYAWIQHMIHHLAPNGKIGLVLANGSLSSTQSGEGDIRKAIIEDDLVEGIVALPAQLFYSVTIPACLWFISKNKKQKGKTVFIDARNLGHMVDRKHRDFTADDIQKIAKTFEAFQEGTLENEKGFCAVVETKAIAEQDYILTPGRYVGIEDKEEDSEPFEEKMERLTTELSELFKQSHVLEEEIKQRLEEIGFEI